MKSKNITDAEKVNEYMQNLHHPLKAEIEAVREIIKQANSKIAERIKWNAPSYYYKKDLVTFHIKNQKQVHLVFHHIAIVSIRSMLLEGDYKDRRMAYFPTMEFIEAHKDELTAIINELLNYMDTEIE